MNKVVWNQCRALLEEKRFRDLRELLAGENEVELAEVLEALAPEQAILTFRSLPKEQAAEVFSQLPPESREVIVSSATDQELGEIVEELFVDDAVDTLEELPANVANRMLRQAQPGDPPAHQPVFAVSGRVRGQHHDGRAHRPEKNGHRRRGHCPHPPVGGDCESIYTCYVTDSQRMLEGVVSLRQLLLAADDTPVEALMDPSVITARHHRRPGAGGGDPDAL